MNKPTHSIRPLLAAVIGLTGAAMIAPAAFAHPGHSHGPGHNPHTHLSTDYSYDEEKHNPYAPPEPAGDGYYWWKGNLHTHSLWSDGDQFPEVIVDWYVQHGYHFLALSDHNILSQGEFWIEPATNRYTERAGGMEVYEIYRERFGDDWVETRENNGALEVRLKPLNEFRSLFERAGEFLLVQSEEITEREHDIHVNATNIMEVIMPQTGETVSDTIRLNIDAVHDQSREYEQPMLPHLNHPNFRWAVTAEDMAPVESLQFFEVYNGHRGVANFGDDVHVDLDRMWDIVLTLRLAEKDLGIVYGLATDDAHNYADSPSDTSRPGRGWVVARSRFLTPEHLIRALEDGDFYSSTGVTMHEIAYDGDEFRVAVDPEPGVSYTIQFIGTREGYDSTREPKLDEDGEPIRTTKQYSDDIGAVLKEVEASHAVYEMQGDEIYVRAKIISSKPKENYFAEGEREKAWIQPVVPE